MEKICGECGTGLRGEEFGDLMEDKICGKCR